ncbi:MAG: DAK2 domain-containing protein [Jatrophihabitans endophyticus]|nr:DAK2 domain-containing protein [Jatrophihabitans endophyticus]
MLETLDAAAVHRWSGAALAGLEAGRAEIDALNVFPVPDGDTGTNMLATLRSAHGVLADAMAGPAPAPADAKTALGAMSRGAATGAIGNSGFILSQILRGLAEAAVGSDGWGPAVLRAGLDTGARLGRQAVVTPVEGTILTVARAAADAAAERLAAGAATLAEVAGAVVRAAAAAVQRTPALLPDLAEAGVVDAGGRGLLVLLHALARTIGGEVVDLAPIRVPPSPSGRGDRPAVDRTHAGYEVQYLLDLAEPAADRLRATLGRVGESVALVPAGPGMWKVHVHVDNVGAAIEAALDHGRPRRIEVVDLGRDERREPGDGVAVVAIAPGSGLAHLFSGEGVHVVDGDVDDVVEAIRRARARDVVLLPNASLVSGVAEAAAARVRAQGVRVTVVPTRSPVQGLAAVAVHDPGRRFDDDVVAMAEAAAATRFAQVTVARAKALTAVGVCEPGDVLGLIDGEVVEIGRGLLAVAFGLVDRLVGVGAELMTVLVGEGAPPRTGALIEAHVRGRAPLTDVTVYEGGQPDHPVVIGVE